MRPTNFAPDVTFSPYWWEQLPTRPTRPLEPPSKVDVVVVGSGYGGASAALALAESGRDTLVIEEEDIGEGASSRNGGAIGESLRVSYSKMVKRTGIETAVAFYTGIREARLFVEDLIQRYRIDCDYARVGRFIGAHTRKHYDSLARDLEMRRKAIGFDAEMVPPSQMSAFIGSDRYFGGRVIKSDGNLQPALFHHGLVKAAETHGARFLPKTRVKGFERDGNSFVVFTTRGNIQARNLIVATNGYTGNLAPFLAKRVIPIQSQIIATEILRPEFVNALIPAKRQMGDTRLLHNYFRASPDGRRILWGGRAGSWELNDRLRSAEDLRRQMVDVFPQLKNTMITHAWAGFIAYTFDSLPHMTAHDGIHYIGGCCGSGVAMQPYLGYKTALKLLGRSEADTPFDNRHPTLPGYTGKPWFVPLVMKFFEFRDRVGI